MICIDTNIIVYIANGTISHDAIPAEPIFYPSIVRIESLGYSSIRSVEEQRVRELFATLSEAPLTHAIIEGAIRLRQDKRMSLGDAIVAATALEHTLVLWTANTDDFKHIESLKLVNPLHR